MGGGGPRGGGWAWLGAVYGVGVGGHGLVPSVGAAGDERTCKWAWRSRVGPVVPNSTRPPSGVQRSTVAHTSMYSAVPSAPRSSR
jgi:hypothetical protein